MAQGKGTAKSPWTLKTPPGKSEYQAWREEDAEPPALVVQVGKTQLRYHLRCVDDLHAWLKAQDDWVLLGNADEGKPVKDGSVEAWLEGAPDAVEALLAWMRRGPAGARVTDITVTETLPRNDADFVVTD